MSDAGPVRRAVDEVDQVAAVVARDRGEVADLHLEQLLARVAAHAAEGVVHLEEATRRVHHGEAVDGGLQDGAVFLLAALKLGELLLQ